MSPPHWFKFILKDNGVQLLAIFYKAIKVETNDFYKCCERFTRLLLGERKYESNCERKKFKQIRLQQVGFECPHYHWVSLPLNLYS